MEVAVDSLRTCSKTLSVTERLMIVTAISDVAMYEKSADLLAPLSPALQKGRNHAIPLLDSLLCDAAASVQPVGGCTSASVGGDKETWHLA